MPAYPGLAPRGYRSIVPAALWLPAYAYAAEKFTTKLLTCLPRVAILTS